MLSFQTFEIGSYWVFFTVSAPGINFVIADYGATVSQQYQAFHIRLFKRECFKPSDRDLLFGPVSVGNNARRGFFP
ncbi:MAG: hypothetical protein PHV59_12105, partial [Victivallales bacterium]|nr:hypothetical protein [Victivallales bacterium]